MKRKLIVSGLLAVVAGLAVVECCTGWHLQPFGSGVVSTAWIYFVPLSTAPLSEVTPDTIESAVLDNDNDVFVVHYYIPGRQETAAQTRVLERLNGRFGGRVTFLSLDVSKHQDVPLCAGIKSSSVVVFALTRANTNNHKMTGYYAIDEKSPGCGYQALLTRIHASLWHASCAREDGPKVWSVSGSNSTNDSLVASRGVPYWNWLSLQTQYQLDGIAKQQ